MLSQSQGLKAKEFLDLLNQLAVRRLSYPR